MNRFKLLDQLVRHEGIRTHPYKDTVGKLTIGVGRNLEDTGISEEEARFLLLNDAIRVEQAIARLIPCYSSLDDVRQRVLLELAFNLGVAGLLKFTKMLAAVEARAWDVAAVELLDSVAAHQWGEERRRDLTVMLREGTDV